MLESVALVRFLGTCSEAKADGPGAWRKLPPPAAEEVEPALSAEATEGDEDDEGFSEVKSRSTTKRAAKLPAQASKNGSSHGGQKKEPWGKGDRAAIRSTAPKKGGAW